MSDKKTLCDELLFAGKWYQRKCSKPAKYVCVVTAGNWINGRKQNRCGIHAKRYEKVEEISNG